MEEKWVNYPRPLTAPLVEAAFCGKQVANLLICKEQVKPLDHVDDWHSEWRARRQPEADRIPNGGASGDSPRPEPGVSVYEVPDRRLGFLATFRNEPL